MAPAATLTALQVDVPEAGHVLAAVERARLPGATLLRPAHISLAYPWLEPVEAFGRVGPLERAVAGVAPFPLRLGSVAVFPPRRGRAVVHLEPEPAEPLRALAGTLGVDTAALRPHLSIARVDEHLVGDVTALVAPLLPIAAVARTVELHVQYERRWWRVEHVLHLGGAPWDP